MKRPNSNLLLILGFYSICVNATVITISNTPIAPRRHEVNNKIYFINQKKTDTAALTTVDSVINDKHDNPSIVQTLSTTLNQIELKITPIIYKFDNITNKKHDGHPNNVEIFQESFRRIKHHTKPMLIDLDNEINKNIEHQKILRTAIESWNQIGHQIALLYNTIESILAKYDFKKIIASFNESMSRVEIPKLPCPKRIRRATNSDQNKKNVYPSITQFFNQFLLKVDLETIKKLTQIDNLNSEKYTNAKTLVQTYRELRSICLDHIMPILTDVDNEINKKLDYQKIMQTIYESFHQMDGQVELLRPTIESVMAKYDIAQIQILIEESIKRFAQKTSSPSRRPTREAKDNDENGNHVDPNIKRVIQEIWNAFDLQTTPSPVTMLRAKNSDDKKTYDRPMYMWRKRREAVDKRIPAEKTYYQNALKDVVHDMYFD